MNKYVFYFKKTGYVFFWILICCMGADESAAQKTGEANFPDHANVPLTVELFEEPVSTTLKEGHHLCYIHLRMAFNWVGDSVMYISKARLSFDFQGQGISIFDIKNSAFVGGTPAGNTSCGDKGYFTVQEKKLTICFDQAPRGAPLALYKTNALAVRDVAVTLQVQEGGCLTGVSLTQAEIRQTQPKVCVPSVSTARLNLPRCLPRISGSIKTQTGQGVQEVTVRATDATECDRTIATDSLGSYLFCACGSGEYTITPVCKDHTFHGVTTLDLAAISKHILHTTLLDSPYKIIAADANQSASVTTLDIVALRRLILGTDAALPNNDFWRFVDKKYVFPDPQNPFTEAFPEWVSVTPTEAHPHVSEADFVAIKVGDVQEEARPLIAGDLQTFEVPARTVEQGQLFTLPLRFAGSVPLTALQTALQFDPSLLEFVGPAAGDADGLSPDCFGRKDVQQGILRLIWLAPDPVEAPLQAGQTLCVLIFRAKKPVSSALILLRFDEKDRLKPEGYTGTTEAVYPLTLQHRVVEEQAVTGKPAAPFGMECRPDPVKHVPILFIQAEHPVEQGRLFVLDAFGGRVAYRELAVAAGASQIRLQEAAGWPVGLYRWVLLSGSRRLSEGSFLKAD